MPNQPVILMAVNCEQSSLRLREAFARADLARPVQFVENGQQAISYLTGQEPYSDPSQNPRPDLVLIDMDLPDHDGCRVIEWIRRHPATRRVGVVALSSKGQTTRAPAAYESGANSFLLEPTELEKPDRITELLQSWMTTFVKPQTGPDVRKKV